jgi:hypothetical protein
MTKLGIMETVHGDAVREITIESKVQTAISRIVTQSYDGVERYSREIAISGSFFP